jgi:hypothetical protein
MGTWRLISWSFALMVLTVLMPSCLRDFDQFEVSESPANSGGSSATNVGGMPSTITGGMGGQLSGSGGSDSAECAPGFLDCDGDAAKGCEHGTGSFNETMCGGCSADCTSIGLSNCQDARCGCSQAAECEGDAHPDDASCVGRICACAGLTCNQGEICARDRNSASCSCGGKAPCASGWVCCPGEGGASCKELDGGDTGNCGACGWTCRSGEICQSGTCRIP